MEDIKTQHNDEVELLQSILVEGVTILTTEPFHIMNIEVSSDVNSKIKILFEVEFTESYPNSDIFKFKISEITNHTSTSQLINLKEKINTFASENIGFPILFQVIEIIKDTLHQIEDAQKKKSEDEYAKLLEKMRNEKSHNEKGGGLFMNKSYTVVTKESYEAWFEKFIAEQRKINSKEYKLKKEMLSRKTGREYFLDLKLKKIENGDDKNDFMIEDGLEDDNKDDGNDEDIDYNKLRKEKKEFNKEEYDENSEDNNQYEDFDHDIFKQDLNEDDINFDDD